NSRKILAGNVRQAEASFVTERWPSGLRRTPAKRVYPKRVPRVQIPLSPPASFKIADFISNVRFGIRNLEPESNAPVAQLDRAPDYGSGGWGFKSLRARQISRSCLI